MRPETRQALADAQLAATRIQEVSDPLDEQRFRDDWLAQSAVERQFMVLGEALIRVKQLEPSVLESVTDHHKIIGLRHLLAHGYDAVDTRQLFRATGDPLQRLARELEELVKS